MAEGEGQSLTSEAAGEAGKMRRDKMGTKANTEKVNAEAEGEAEPHKRSQRRSGQDAPR